MKKLFVLLVAMAGLQLKAQTLVVSDIDDTLKISHVLSSWDMIGNADETGNAFVGMSALFKAIKTEKPDTEFVYLSNAPDWLMEDSHREFLQRQDFPDGILILRDDLDKSVHKLNNLRRLLKSKNYEQVILLGDNGERDAAIYNQIKKEFPRQNINVYIRLLYSARNHDERGQVLKPGQIGFVTAVDISYDLYLKNQWTQKAWESFASGLTPQILSLPLDEDEGLLAFPDWQDCRDYQWNIMISTKDLDTLKNFVEKRCSL